jgi:glycosyltransferase involved in cell wall biosynthesis
MKKVVCFHPHSLYPALSGAHRRGLEVLGALRELGWSVTLAGSPLSSQTPWLRSSREGLRRHGLTDVRLYHGTEADYAFLLARGERCKRRRSEQPFDLLQAPPPGMRAWFSDLLSEVAPDLVLITYAHWDGLLDHRRFAGVRRVLDTYDVVTLNVRLWRELEKRFPTRPIRVEEIEDEVLQEDFYARRGLAADPEEFRICDRYPTTVAIAARDAELIEQNTRKTEVVTLPATHPPRYLDNDYSGPALFPTGPNPFNLQGYCYFVKRVLPRVLARAPSFQLQMTGSCCGEVTPVEGVLLSGYVPDLMALYRSARMMLCPVFGGTGQQIKIIEAMSHGVPVVALRAAAEASPLRHGVNGLVAEDASGFAEHVLELWNNRELCARLGAAARETIATELSRERLLTVLSKIVERTNVS